MNSPALSWPNSSTAPSRLCAAIPIRAEKHHEKNRADQEPGTAPQRVLGDEETHQVSATIDEEQNDGEPPGPLLSAQKSHPRASVCNCQHQQQDARPPPHPLKRGQRRPVELRQPLQ